MQNLKVMIISDTNKVLVNFFSNSKKHINIIIQQTHMPSKKWFMKFSNTKKVEINPYNHGILKSVKKFENKIIKILGNCAEIEHRGASALGIAGKGEVDFYVRVAKKDFDLCLKKLTKFFGSPDKLEKLRARFNRTYTGIEFEIILIYKNHIDEITGRLFFNYLKEHPKELRKYEELKKKYAKVSEKEYYIQKDKFIRRILKLARNRVV